MFTPFLLPVQLSALGVPSRAVTPTDLLFNVVAAPGALVSYPWHGSPDGLLTRLLALGTIAPDWPGPGLRPPRLIPWSATATADTDTCSHFSPAYSRPRSRPLRRASPDPTPSSPGEIMTHSRPLASVVSH